MVQVDQCGFCPGGGTMNQLDTFVRLLEESCPTSLHFVDVEASPGMWDPPVKVWTLHEDLSSPPPLVPHDQICHRCKKHRKYFFLQSGPIEPPMSCF